MFVYPRHAFWLGKSFKAGRQTNREICSQHRLFGVVGALGLIYCIILGAKLAKAEEPQDREKAKNSLKNAIIGFLLIFVLMIALLIGLPAMIDWVNSTASTQIGVF